jgi:hypothetical protein
MKSLESLCSEKLPKELKLAYQECNNFILFCDYLNNGRAQNVHLDGRFSVTTLMDPKFPCCTSYQKPVFVRFIKPTVPLEEEDLVIFRWDSPEAIEFWAEVNFWVKDIKKTTIKGRSVPPDTKLSYCERMNDGSLIFRWDSRFDPTFWASLTIRNDQEERVSNKMEIE